MLRRIVLSLFLAVSIQCTAIAEEHMSENSFRYNNGVPIYTESSEDVSLFSDETGVKGIDVSTFQGVIDWESVKNDGVEFAIIRCGYGDNKTAYDDAYWKRNADECTRLGIPFGVYLYSYAASIEEAESEAAHALRLLEGYELSYPVFLDLEDDVVGACSNKLIGEMADIFCTALQRKGYMVGIYANTNWWTNRLTDEVFDDPTWHKWVADWRGYCGYDGEYSFWQYTSSGSVSGIYGNVDMNYGYRSFDTLGDVDGDGDIDAWDPQLLTELLLRMDVTTQDWLLRVADMDSSGEVNITDAYLIGRLISDAADGDVNGDGITDAGDAGVILRYDAGLTELESEVVLTGDINNDGMTDAGDAGIILRKDAGLELRR